MRRLYFLASALILIFATILILPGVAAYYFKHEIQSHFANYTVGHSGVSISLTKYKSHWFDSNAEFIIQINNQHRHITSLNANPIGIKHVTLLANVKIFNGPLAFIQTATNNTHLAAGLAYFQGQIVTSDNKAVANFNGSINFAQNIELNINVPKLLINQGLAKQTVKILVNDFQSHIFLQKRAACFKGDYQIASLKFQVANQDLFSAAGITNTFTANKNQNGIWLGNNSLHILTLTAQQHEHNAVINDIKLNMNNTLHAQSVLSHLKGMATELCVDNICMQKIKLNLALRGSPLLAMSPLQRWQYWQHLQALHTGSTESKLSQQKNNAFSRKILPQAIAATHITLKTLQMQTANGLLSMNGVVDLPRSLPMFVNNKLPEFKFLAGLLAHTVSSLDASLKVIAPQAFVKHVMQSNLLSQSDKDWLSRALKQDYLHRDQQNYVAHMVFSNGMLYLNGKWLPLFMTQLKPTLAT